MSDYNMHPSIYVHSRLDSTFNRFKGVTVKRLFKGH